MSESSGTLVIGLGNPLMGDDGLGLAALDRLHATWQLPRAVVLHDGGTWGLNLLHSIEDADKVLFLDAVRTGREPGTLVELEGRDLPRTMGIKLSPHQIDLREVLALLELRGTAPPTMVCLGLEPASVELHTGLSPRVAGRLDGMVEAAARRLRAWGHPLRRRRRAYSADYRAGAGAGLPTGDPGLRVLDDHLPRIR
jgi:hydrogenase maturation protease